MSADTIPAPEYLVEKAFKRGFDQGYQEHAAEAQARTHSQDWAAFAQGERACHEARLKHTKNLARLAGWKSRGCQLCGCAILEVPLPNGKVAIRDLTLRPHRDTCEELPHLAAKV